MKTQPSRSVSYQVELNTTFLFTFGWTVWITTVSCFGAHDVVQALSAENQGMTMPCAAQSADLLAVIPQEAKLCAPTQR